MGGSICPTHFCNFCRTMVLTLNFLDLINPNKMVWPNGKNHHLLMVARSLLFIIHVPKSYWSKAVLTSYYLVNRMPSPIDIASLHKQVPILLLQVFGCVCLVHFHSGDKLSPRSVRCLFFGYSPTNKRYKCLDPLTGKTCIHGHHLL